jgi:hypothetical protein
MDELERFTRLLNTLRESDDRLFDVTIGRYELDCLKDRLANKEHLVHQYYPSFSCNDCVHSVAMRDEQGFVVMRASQQSNRVTCAKQGVHQLLEWCPYWMRESGL